MDFFTKVQVEPLPRRIGVHDRILSLGSCFAQAVGGRMQASCFNITVNPSGTLYNPESIAMELDKGVEADVLLLTFGTSHVYRRDGVVVQNCQKLPARLFTEGELTVEEIVARYSELIPRLRTACPQLQVIFTVSPYRYMKYGLHGSALSKARLLLAVDEICKRLDGCHYFPAYEIVTDELRDYRYYDADMVHPNAVAADYVWEQFQAHCLDTEAQRFVKEYAPIRRALEHRPFNPDSEEYRDFINKTESKRKEILARYGL